MTELPPELRDALEPREGVRKYAQKTRENPPVFERPKLSDEERSELRADLSRQIHNVVEVTISRCETAEELFELRDLLISLNGLTGSIKRSNG